MKSERLETSKKNAISFHQLMFNQNKPAEVIERFVGAEYIQHNPHVSDGKMDLLNISKKWLKNIPIRKFILSDHLLKETM